MSDIISDLTKKLFPSQNNFEKSIKLEKCDENLDNNCNNIDKIPFNDYNNNLNKNYNNINNNDYKNNNKNKKIYTNINNSKMIYYKPEKNYKNSDKNNNDLIYVNPSLLKNKSDTTIDIDVLEKEAKSNNTKKKKLNYDIKINQIINLEKDNDYYKKFENI